MSGYLPGYELDPTTWVYLSSFLTVGMFFKFHRLWSIRNLDLLALIAFAPGLLWIALLEGQWGYVWLFTVGGLFLVRLLLDPLMVRRPLLEPNLNASGLTFTGVALLVFLMTNVVTGKVPLLAKQPITSNPEARVAEYPLIYAVADLSAHSARGPGEAIEPTERRRELARVAITRAAAILAHLAVVIGIVLVGYRHFDNFHMGVGMASLYLLLPYTAQMTPRVDHVIPAALLAWAVVAYRRPWLAGVSIGLAAGLIGYPLFLLPLWCSFYWRRGLIRFIIGVAAGAALLVVLLILGTWSLQSFGVSGLGSTVDGLQHLFGWATPWRFEASGFWEHHGQAFRIPLVAAFVVLCASLALWPAHKNLGTLLSCSAAVMLSVQFWHAYQGGVYMAWYLPLLVMTVFRPNLEDRVALTAVIEGQGPWQPGGRAAWRIEEWAAWARRGLFPWRRETQTPRRKESSKAANKAGQ